VISLVFFPFFFLLFFAFARVTKLLRTETVSDDDRFVVDPEEDELRYAVSLFLSFFLLLLLLLLLGCME
jgi:hypothetical protein